MSQHELRCPVIAGCRAPRGTPAQRWRVAILLSLAMAGASRADDWPQFRGPNCSGVSTSKKPLVTEFSATKNVVWSAELGEGIGSPAIVAGRVFSTAMIGDSPTGKKFVAYGLDAATGKELWKKEFEAGPEPLPPIYELNSYASASPAADADRVYLYFARKGLFALDAKDGHTVWEYPLPEPFFIFDWGPGMSPVLFGDMLLFCQDDDLSPALYAIDKKTGGLLWKDDRSDMAVCYSHPVICTTKDGPEIVVAGTGRLIGYDPRDGKRKWKSDLFCRNIKTTPVSHDGVVYVSVESFGISYQWRAQADKNGDGKITREEIQNSRVNKEIPIPEAFWKKFERGDVNRDGILEGEEIDLAFLDPSNKGGLLAAEVEARAKGEKDVAKIDGELQKESSFQAVRGGGTGDVSQSHLIYKKISKAPDHVVSPLVVNGRILFVKTGGIASCFDAQKGNPIWERKRIGNEGTYLASPVYGDGKIYIAGQNGNIVVLEDGPELKILSKNDMGEGVIGTPGIADGRIFIRTRSKLYCIADERRASAP